MRFIPDLEEQDIGAVGVAGSSEGDRVNVTMRASGDDIWNQADAVAGPLRGRAAQVKGSPQGRPVRAPTVDGPFDA